jgi:hypothetical protein
MCQCLSNSTLVSLRKRNTFLLQNDALKCDISDVKGRSKYNTFKIWYKTSEIRATLGANLAPPRHMFPFVAASTSDREPAEEQAWLLLATKASIVNSQALHAATRDSIMYKYVLTFLRKRVCAQEVACPLDS